MRSASGIILAMILALGLLTTWNIFYLRELRSGVLQADHHLLGSARVLKTNTERAVELLDQASSGRAVDLERHVKPLLVMATGVCGALMRGEPPESGRFAGEAKNSVQLLFVDLCWRLSRSVEWADAGPAAKDAPLRAELVDLVRNAHARVEGVVERDEEALDRIDGGIVAAFFVGFVGLAFVVFSDRKALESRNAVLTKARDAALESSRLKQAFISNLSHEIRTPLTIMLGALDSLEIAEGEELDTIRRNAGRLTATIDAIIDLAQIESGGFRINGSPLELGPAIEDVVRPLRAHAESLGLRFVCHLPAAGAVVRFDEHGFALILSQLVRNAIKFTPEGSVTVELKREKSGSLAMVVSDTGIGMERSFLPFAFDPFSQEDPSHTRAFEGSGLGLALVNAHAALNGATVSVWSKRGRGTTFTVRFSRESELAGGGRPATDARPRVGSPVRAEKRGPSMTTLVFASEALAAKLGAALGGEHRILVTRSVKQAFGLLEAHVADMRMVIAEVGFDGSHDGFGFVRFLRADPRWQSLPVLMIGDDPTNAARERALQAGSTLYVPGSVRPAALVQLVANLLHRSSKGAAGEPADAGLARPEKPDAAADTETRPVTLH